MPAVPLPSVYEVGGPSTTAAEGQSFPLPAPGLHIPPSVIEDLSTRLGNLEYGHGQLVKKVTQMSDAEVAAGVTIREIGLRVFAIEGQVQVTASQMVHVADIFEQIGTPVEHGSSATKGFSNSAAADYSFKNGQPGEHTDAMYFGDG
ncbi:hypothetical protein Tco_0967404 [Tanacetum coccineum]